MSVIEGLIGEESRAENMKIRVALNPTDFRCSRKNPNPRVNWCYKVVKSKLQKGFVVQVKVYGRLVVGHLGDDCYRITGHASERKAKVFGSAKTADQAAQKCILPNRRRSSNI